MTAIIDNTPAHKNYLVWMDLAERIEQALATLRSMQAQQDGSERLQGKIEGVQEAQAEFQRLEEEDMPYLSMFVQWLSSRLIHPADNDQRERGPGYSLVLDYAHAY